MRSNLFTSLLTLIPVLGDLALGYEVQVSAFAIWYTLRHFENLRVVDSSTRH